MPVLEFSNVSKSYADSSVALKSLSFSIEEGSFVALAGPSGSGKTSALNLSAGLDTPTSGEISLLGEKIHALSPKKMIELRRKSVGFVFQSYNLFPVLTALENVEYPLALRRVPQKLRREIAISLLSEVGLVECKNKRPSEMSGGQQQRVAVARAMVTNPKIVFADEPTANLDSKSSEILLRIFKNLNERRKTTFLFSSHDTRVLKVAKEVIYLRDGEVDTQRPLQIELDGEMKYRSLRS